MRLSELTFQEFVEMIDIDSMDWLASWIAAQAEAAWREGL